MRKPAEIYNGKCPVCGAEFIRPMKNVRDALKKGARVITCSRECAANKAVKFGGLSERVH